MDANCPEKLTWSFKRASIAGGPVTCVRFDADGAIAIGRGSYLEFVGELVTSNLVVFPSGCTIHGIHFVCESILVYGGRQLALLRRCDEEKEALKHCLLQPEKAGAPSLAIETSDWIHDVSIASKSKLSYTIALAHANNACEIWTLMRSGSQANTFQAKRLRKVVCATRCITYAMAFDSLRDESDSDLKVASGTVFNEILLWDVKDFISEGPDTSRTAKITQKLQGHEGVILALKFQADGGFLASASDDRSVRGWKSTEVGWTAAFVCWGHTARVWDVVFAKQAILSSSEDGTVRMWSTENGDSLGEMKCYPAQSLWCLDSRSSSVVVGGNDGSARTFDMQDYMVVEQNNHDKFTAQGTRRLIIPLPDDRVSIHAAAEQPPRRSAEGEMQTAKKKHKASKLASSQVVFGMSFYNTESTQDPRILVATRTGSLMSFSLCNNEWTHLQPWRGPSLENSTKAGDGTSMAVHGEVVAVGTTIGLLVVLKLTAGASNVQRCNGLAEKYRSVQATEWVASDTVVSMHIRGIAVVWKLQWHQDQPTLSRYRVLNTTLGAIPCCMSPWSDDSVLILGDCRGNLSCFDLKSATPESEELRPTSILSKAHRKEHINCVQTLPSGRLASGGNDGCVQEFTVNSEGLEKTISLPISGLSSVNDIQVVRCGRKQTKLVTGYFGNIYVARDVTHGYDIFRFDTGGRHRKLDCFFSSSRYGVCVCVGRKDGGNDLIVQDQYEPHARAALVLGSAGAHPEPVFDCCLFRTRPESDYIACLSGGEDCTGRLSIFRTKDGASFTKQLPPQESCVRAVCTSQHPSTNQTLLVVGGGKLAIQFFVVKDLNSSFQYESILDGMVVTQIGVGRMPAAPIDQRVNAAKAVPLASPHDDRSHLVVVGDSSGTVSYLIVHERLQEKRFGIKGIQLAVLQRPVLSIDLLAVAGRHLLMVGTTGGDIFCWDLPGDKDSFDCDDVSSAPIKAVKAHEMGTNSISASVLEIGIHPVISICSCGDDQSLTALRSRVQVDMGKISALQILGKSTVKEASMSALKGVALLTSDVLVSVGYSQRLGLWHWSVGGMELVRSISVAVADVNSLGLVSVGPSSQVVAIGGEGIEFIHIKTNE